MTDTESVASPTVLTAPTVLHQLAVLNRKGDDRITWMLGDAASEKVAADLFTKLRAQGHSMFTAPTDGTPPQRLEQFDATQTRVVAVPIVVGG